MKKQSNSLKPETIRSMYESNWKWMTGLQMSSVVAHLGYEIVDKLSKEKCLDIGCGDGTNAKKLNELGFKTEGCDISDNAVKKANKMGIEATRVDINDLPLPFKSSSYNLIWLSDVVEHIFWPDGLMKDINRILKKDGYVFLSTPNVSWWGIRLQILLGKTLRDLHPEHVWWFNQKQLHKLLSENGFKIVEGYGYNCLVPHPLVFKYPILNKLNWVGKINNLFTYTFAILIKKND